MRSICVAAAICGCSAAAPWMTDSTAPIEGRVEALMAVMTLEAKIAQTLQLSDSQNVNFFPPPAGPARYAWLLETFPDGFGAIPMGWLGYVPGFINAVDIQNALQQRLIDNSTYGIPMSVWTETLHSAQGSSTIFPGPVGLGSTWNLPLVQSVAASIGAQARIMGIVQSFSPELQVDTDPRFGRLEESFGEDPHLVAAMGVAYATGIQGGAIGGPDTYANISALVTEAKHFAAYGQAGMDSLWTSIDNRTLFDVYLRPWRDFARKAGGRGAMVSHQNLNGMPNHANSWLLTDVWRGLFGANHTFLGSDDADVARVWSGFGLAPDSTTAASLSVAAGLDMDLGPVAYQNLSLAVELGYVDVEHINRAAANVLRFKFAAGLFDGHANGTVNYTSLVDTPAHRALAYTAAVESAVLLVNRNGTLPLDIGGAIKRILVVGPNAGCAGGPAATCVYDTVGASPIDAQHGAYIWDSVPTVTVLAAINASVGTPGGLESVVFLQGANWTTYDTPQLAEAVAAAAAADIVIAVVGDTWCNYGCGTCAEGLDADSLDLPGGQLALLNALTTQSTTPVVTVLIHGRPATFGAGPFAATGANNALLSGLSAVLAAWRPGEEGGSAVWDILRGAANPSGRLAQNWLRNVGAVRGPSSPWFQPRENGLNLAYVTEPTTPLFPFGFGLSYFTPSLGTELAVSPPGPLSAGSTFNVTVKASTVGPAGQLVVQIYASQDAPTKFVRYQRWLLCWGKFAMPANAAATPLTVACDVDHFDAYDPDVGDYVVYTGNYTLTAALDSADAARQATTASVGVVGNYDWVPPYWRGARARLSQGKLDVFHTQAGT